MPREHPQKPKRKSISKKTAVLYLSVMAAAVISLLFLLFGSLSGDSKASVPVPDGSAAVYFVDVGQGDCTLIQACGKNILIDSGEYAEYDNVREFLDDHGVKTLDIAYITHPHSDHMGCMYKLLRKFGAGEVIMPDIPDELTPENITYTALLDVIAEKDIPLTEAKPGRTIELGESCRLEILAPVGTYEDLNNISAAVKFVYGSTSFLICGDIEAEAESDILASGADVSADVIRTPHHGSSSSSTYAFIRAVKPRYAVFSVGTDNDYGHPHAQVIEHYRTYGAQIYRTDINGDITFITDGENITASSQKSQELPAAA